LASTAVLGASLLVPATSQGTVTIGSNMNSAPSIGIGCVGALCTRLQTSLPAGQVATNGITSPVNGSVVFWRVRSAAANTQQPITFRVGTPTGIGLFTGGGAFGPVTPPDLDATTPYAASTPIKLGDVIGLDFTNNVTTYFRNGAANAGRLFNPALALGSTRPPESNVTEEALISAEIEPTSAFTLGKPKARNGGKLKIRATLPNAGTLVAGLKGDKKIPSAATAKVVKRTTRTASAAGTLTFKVKPTKATQNRLVGGGTIKVRIKVAFTPDNGKTATRTIKAKLKG